MFLLVPADSGSPGPRAVKRLCVCACHVATAAAPPDLSSKPTACVDRQDRQMDGPTLDRFMMLTTYHVTHIKGKDKVSG